ncbi:putative transposon protein [Symbiodinium microadriaticum]|uniref:Putative transposon protein n=1 Tax=Symbiodinium microadriaticum TaxID=2951 RepID=A0A1Q9EUY1_SYMMI|nr:putative transposon protein [Symbiodinium microadriaticum]CAE7251196.1 RE1 [Symbiodinium sp. KB8]
MELDEEEKVSGGDELPEDEASSDDGGEVEGEVEELTKKVEYGTVYVTRCLRRRTGPHVLQAAKEILLQLRQSELHVATIHTDRAPEFKAKAFKTWVNDEKIRHSRTAGGDPAANSTAELGVKWAKSRVRALLKSGNASPNEWPMAIDHASAQMWSKAFPHSPWTNAPAVAFGSEVWYRAKTYKGKREKIYDPDGTRWKKGLHRGPARDVSRGHLILREDGGLTIAKGVKFNILDPDRALPELVPNSIVEGVPINLIEDNKPPSRTELKDEIEFMARKAIHEKFTVEEVIKIFEKLEELGDTDFRTTRKSPMTSWFSGAFVHGGKAGRILELEKEKLVEFVPSRWHEVQPWKGERLVLLAHTPRASKLQDDHISELQNVGFTIDKVIVRGEGALVEEEERVDINKFEVMNGGEPHQAFVEVEELDWELPSSSTPTQLLPKALIKKTEVQYTQNIEQVLHDLRAKGEVLEITHTVNLADVKKNLGDWYDSAVKEYTNLKDGKKAFKVTKRWNLPEGCKIPCKGVFTVKPDKHPNPYKRKTRFVACGNHLPEGSMMPEGFDLFAAGLDATSLRSMFAHTAGKGWLTGTTDIRQAFVLAPWLGVPVALQPPAIAFELGLAEHGDMWEVLMSIYGLRESPALWSGFRDQELKNAVWEVVDVDSPQEALGYIMVYIDDLLIAGPPEILHSFFGWVSARWEVDDLNILKENHPIRFLGMELHKVPGGAELAQEGFIKELLRSYGHNGSRSWSQGSRETLVLTAEEEEAIINAAPASMEGREAEVKQAQRQVGEMLWLTGRSRPDIQYRSGPSLKSDVDGIE